MTIKVKINNVTVKQFRYTVNGLKKAKVYAKKHKGKVHNLRWYMGEGRPVY